MMYEIELIHSAIGDLKWFPKKDQIRLRKEITSQLQYEPGVATRNRKRLRPGHVSEWELRVDELRVFYEVDDDDEGVVKIVAIGYKEGNKLFFRGQEYDP